MRMSLKVSISVLSLFVSLTSSFAEALNFQMYDFAAGEFRYVYTRVSTVITPVTALKADGWTYKLYRDITGDGADVLGVDETEIASWSGSGNWGSPEGWFSASFNDAGPVLNGQQVFVRVFDPTGGGYYFNLVPNSTTGNGSVINGTYKVSYSGPGDEFYMNSTPIDGSGWQAVPEPGTLALMGLGAVVLALRKRRQARKG